MQTEHLMLKLLDLLWKNVAILCRRKLTSFERSTDFSGIPDVSIRRSSSVVIQNLGKRDIK